MSRLSIPEIFLLQLVLYVCVWLWDDYVATYVCIILPVVILVILGISWIVDLIEPAHVGRKYYYVMAISAITPVLVGAFFYYLHGGDLAWLKPLE